MTAPSLLAALSATLAPGRAEVLARCAAAGGAAEAVRLAALPAADRLAALEAALGALPAPAPEARAVAAAAERPRLAALLRDDLAARAAPSLLRRLLLERLSGAGRAGR